MSESSDNSYTRPRPSKYSKISQKTRQKLIELVIQNNTKISSAAKILKIKHSTAKMIIGKYKKMLGVVGTQNNQFEDGIKNRVDGHGEGLGLGKGLGLCVPGYYYELDSGNVMGMFYLLLGAAGWN